MGLTYHTVGTQTYWDESAYWEFTTAEIDQIEAATAELQEMCLAAGDFILKHDRLTSMGIPEAAKERIRETWRAEPPALYGRMDLAYNGYELKLLEYNADTPTALVESAVAQWYWLKAVFPGADQFNSIHEHLVAKWRQLAGSVRQPVHFACEDCEEDWMTITYLRDTAQQAGLQTVALGMAEIGWDGNTRRFVDEQGSAIEAIFKLYPWEALVSDRFGSYALETMGTVQWIEPIWKMLWSNKALLAVLWELYPNHPNLVPAYLDGPRDLTRYVKKPRMSREGANITYVGDTRIETGGDYGDEGFVYQALAPVPMFDGNYAVIGSWVVDGVACGMGVRESDGPITDNLSRFVPHLFR